MPLRGSLLTPATPSASTLSRATWRVILAPPSPRWPVSAPRRSSTEAGTRADWYPMATLPLGCGMVSGHRGARVAARSRTWSTLPPAYDLTCIGRGSSFRPPPPDYPELTLTWIRSAPSPLAWGHVSSRERHRGIPKGVGRLGCSLRWCLRQELEGGPFSGCERLALRRVLGSRAVLLVDPHSACAGLSRVGHVARPHRDLPIAQVEDAAACGQQVLRPVTLHAAA